MNREKGEGVPDFVLMDVISEDALMQNIKLRYQTDNIYTYIGSVVVAMNPYKRMEHLYNKNKIDEYRGRYMYEVAPHIYALSNDVYRSLLQNQEDQCVIISGESGAGKTESSKILMQYISAVSKSSTEVDRVKSQLLDSNPILEAFGNAKTLRNDNSSRFGKYMEIQFEKDGSPVGGKISNYLLEKSRVVNRAKGERSFHIFYQLLSGCRELNQYQLQPDPNNYYYLKHSDCSKVETINDPSDFQQVLKGMEVLGFSPQEKASMWRILAGILHLGNVNFAETKSPTGQTRVVVQNDQAVAAAASCFQCHLETLKKALTSRTISTGVGKRQSVINVPLDAFQAVFTRDALAKAIYERLFNWIVIHINERLVCRIPGPKLVVGVLDIYGFEIFENNSFEQFCINLCNEKLQQLFIELTLKSEQEEYVREGIKWEPIKYFNNKIICDLIEGKPMGVIALLDECCLLADSTDITFLDKCNKNFNGHAHYESYSSTQDRTISNQSFRLKHYAGDVTYNVIGFLDKNKDTLFIDLVQTMLTSKDPLLASLFPAPDINDKKRPLTASTQFKNALGLLMAKLLACQPHYIRCIKPNDYKKAGQFDDDRVRHQVRYLGLLENVRVRRAGFAYRSTYDRFLWRYKMVCQETWPNFRGDPRAGVERILQAHSVKAEEFRLGKTKVFIRNPTTLFYFEEKREEMMPRVVSMMQAAWKGFVCRSKWAERKAAIKIQMFYRKYRFRRYFKDLNRAFANVRNDAPNWGKYVQWPANPAVLNQGVFLLRKVWANWRARMMVLSLTPEEQAHMRQKVLAYDIFRGNKPWDIPRRFDADYLEKDSNPHKDKYIIGMQTLFSTYGDTQIMFADYVAKVNKVGKSQKRGIVITEQNIYKHDPKNYKVRKFGTPIVEVKSISCSPRKDTFVILHCKEPYRDFVLDLGTEGEEKVSEFVTVLVQEYRKLTGEGLPIHFSDRISYNNSRTNEKPGKNELVVFEGSNDPKLKHCQFKTGKGQNIVFYPH